MSEVTTHGVVDRGTPDTATDARAEELRHAGFTVYGQLEGVAPEFKEAVGQAAKRENVSVVAWLEKAIKSSLPESPP